MKMSLEFKVANCWKEGKNFLKMHLIEHKRWSLLPQLRKKYPNYKKSGFKQRHFHILEKNKKINHFFKKVKSHGN